MLNHVDFAAGLHFNVDRVDNVVDRRFSAALVTAPQNPPKQLQIQLACVSLSPRMVPGRWQHKALNRTPLSVVEYCC